MTDDTDQERRQAFLEQVLEVLRDPDFPTEEWVVRAYSDTAAFAAQRHLTEESAVAAAHRLKADPDIETVVVRRGFSLRVYGDQEYVLSL